MTLSAIYSQVHWLCSLLNIFLKVFSTFCVILENCFSSSYKRARRIYTHGKHVSMQGCLCLRQSILFFVLLLSLFLLDRHQSCLRVRNALGILPIGITAILLNFTKRDTFNKGATFLLFLLTFSLRLPYKLTGYYFYTTTCVLCSDLFCTAQIFPLFPRKISYCKIHSCVTEKNIVRNANKQNLKTFKYLDAIKGKINNESMLEQLYVMWNIFFSDLQNAIK